jgi:hypothetical protein
MSEIALFLLAVLGVFSLLCSGALIALGKVIDRFPPSDESARERGISGPVESTRLVVVLFWALFIPGGWAVLQESPFLLVVGITTLFAISLFMFTATVFSFAVLSAMSNRVETYGETVIQPASLSGQVPHSSSDPEPTPMSGGKKPVMNVLMNALLKK